jgi:organic hydroperoxide reductase OsmC/OhrA
MEEVHPFRVVAWWASARTGIAKSNSAPNAIHFTSPPAFGGLEGRWTPEDLLLGAVASCYTTTFQTLAEYSKFEYTDLQVETEAVLSKRKKGYGIAEIAIRPRLTISSEPLRRRALDLLDKTETLCLVSRALAVALIFEPKIEVGTVSPVG